MKKTPLNRDFISERFKTNDDGDISFVTDPKRTQLEMHLYSTNKSILIISQIFICAPAAVHKPKTAEETLGDRVLYFLHLMWCVGLYIGLAMCVYDEYTSSNIEAPTVQKPLYFSEYLVYLFHLLEIILTIYVGRETFWKFFDFIIDFDCALADLKVHINYAGLGRFLRTHMALILLHLCCTLIVGYFYSYRIWLNFLRTSTVYIMPNIVIQISLIHYYALLFVTAERSDKLYYLLDNVLLNSKNQDTRDNLHKIRALYAKLEQFTRNINDVFSYAIVLVYVGSYVNICFNIFLMYKFLNDWSKTDLAWAAYSGVWTCMHIGKMWLILYYNENIQNKKTKASYLLSAFRYDDMALEPAVRHFLLQLISDTRSNVICGMAALNLNFTTSLIVAISTLLIFLVQYDITFEALTKTHNAAKPSTSYTGT